MQKWAASILLHLLLAACSLQNPLSALEPTLAPTATESATPRPTLTDLPVARSTQPVPATATETPDFFLCLNSPPMRVQVGDRVRVTETNGLPLRVRSQPVLNPDFVVTQMPEGAEFEIIGGPACASVPLSQDSLVFWEVDLPSRGITGWVAEGDDSGYFIEPVE